MASPGARVRRSHVRVLFGAGVLCLYLAGQTISVDAGASATTAAPAQPTGTGSFLLTATDTGPRYAPTFTGNGELGVRVPPEGQG